MTAQLPDGAELALVPFALAPVSTLGPSTRSPVDAYLDTMAERSRETMRSSLRTIAKLIGAPSPEAIPWEQWRWEHSAFVRGQLDGQGSPTTANRHLSALRGVLKAAWKLGLLSAEHHAQARDIAVIRGERLMAGRALTMTEIRALLEACDYARPRGVQQALIVALLFGGGLRLSEPTRLLVSDYSPGAAELRVMGKGNKQRLVPLTAGTRLALARWLEVRGDWPGPLLVPVDKSGAIQRRGLTPRAVAKSIAELAERAGVLELRTHDFRRTFGTALLDSGADVLLVRGLMGHASVNTTMKYDRRPAQAAARAVQLLNVPYPEKK